MQQNIENNYYCNKWYESNFDMNQILALNYPEGIDISLKK